MVQEFFDSLLQELGRLIELPDLKPDRHNSCRLKLKNGADLRIEPDRSGFFLVLGATIAQIPPGRFRALVFREALRANGMPQPLIGVFAYSTKNDHLILFHKIALKEISGEKIAEALFPFSEKSVNWTQSLARGEIPKIETPSSAPSSGSGIFGLK